MKSTIRVEMDFNIKEPVIQFTLDKESTELADQTLQYFIECASNRGLEVLWPFSHEMNSIKPQLRIKQDTLPNVTGFPEELRQSIRNNSDAFRNWLTEKSIIWNSDEHGTVIIGDYDKFSLGREFGLYEAANRPK